MRRLEVRSAFKKRDCFLERWRACIPSIPRKPLDGLTPPFIQSPPLVFPDGIKRLVQGLHHMKAVDHERGVRAVVLNGPSVGAAHVAAGPANALFLAIR